MRSCTHANRTFSFLLRSRYHYRISVSTLRTTTGFQYQLCVPLRNFSIDFCVPLRDFSIEFAYHFRISVSILRTSIRFQYWLCVPLSDFSIGFAYHYRISVSTLSCVPLSDFSTNFAYVDTEILSGTQIFAYWFGDFSISLFGMWSNTSVFLTIQEEKTIFCLLDFFWRVFLFFILSKSNFPVWFFVFFCLARRRRKK